METQAIEEKNFSGIISFLIVFVISGGLIWLLLNFDSMGEQQNQNQSPQRIPVYRAPSRVFVNGYYRNNGTYVEPHYRNR